MVCMKWDFSKRCCLNKRLLSHKSLKKISQNDGDDDDALMVFSRKEIRSSDPITDVLDANREQVRYGFGTVIPRISKPKIVIYTFLNKYRRFLIIFSLAAEAVIDF